MNKYNQERMRRKLRAFYAIVVCSMVGGGVYGLLRSGSGISGLGQGILTGLLIGTSLTAFEMFYVHGDRGRWLRRKPFLVHITLKSLVFIGVIALGLWLGALPYGGVFSDGSDWLTDQFTWSLAFAILMSFTIQFVTQVNRMLGGRMFANFVIGRYHHPKEETRIFLFLDMVSSTEIAERLGAVKFHALLNAFFYDLTAPILGFRGEIHKYVGDEVIVTWTPDEGLAEHRYLKCCFAMRAAIAEAQDRYRAEFGLVPTFRIGVHAGPVVAGEMGDYKQEIAFLGDTVNTTARIRDACRDHGEELLVSGDLIAMAPPPEPYRCRPLGRQPLRGKRREIELFAVSESG